MKQFFLNGNQLFPPEFKLTNCSVTACVDINTHLHNSVIKSSNNYHAVLTNDRKTAGGFIFNYLEK